MSDTICRCVCQMRYRSGSTVTNPSGPGGSASEPDKSAARFAARRAIASAAASGCSARWVAGAGMSASTRSSVAMIGPCAPSLEAGARRASGNSMGAIWGRCGESTSPGAGVDQTRSLQCGDISIEPETPMRIGVPRETKDGERRVGIVPDGVRALVAAGHQVAVQTDAGAASGFGDDVYRAAGAAITDDAAQIWRCPLIVKVKEIQCAEWPLLTASTTIAGFAQLNRDPALLDAV